MNCRKWMKEEIYSTYKPYPVSWDSKENSYSSDILDNTGSKPSQMPDKGSLQEFPDINDDPGFFDRTITESSESSVDKSFHPLHLLQSLFSDRLDFLQRALDEL